MYNAHILHNPFYFALLCAIQLHIGPQLMDGLSAGRSPPRRKR